MAEQIFIREIRPSKDQATELAQLVHDTSIHTFMHQACFPKGKESLEEEITYRVGQMLRSLDDLTKHHIAAFLETVNPDGQVQEKIVGYTGWSSPPLSGKEKSEEQTMQERAVELSYRPDIMDKDAHDKALVKHGRLFKQLMDGEPSNYWSVFALNVSPAYQRRGIASKMMKWGLQEAVRDGKGVILCSTPGAIPFYLAMGFKRVGELGIREEVYPGMRITPQTTTSHATSSDLPTDGRLA